MCWYTGELLRKENCSWFPAADRFANKFPNMCASLIGRVNICHVAWLSWANILTWLTIMILFTTSNRLKRCGNYPYMGERMCSWTVTTKKTGGSTSQSDGRSTDRKETNQSYDCYCQDLCFTAENEAVPCCYTTDGDNLTYYYDTQSECNDLTNATTYWGWKKYTEVTSGDKKPGRVGHTPSTGTAFDD